MDGVAEAPANMHAGAMQRAQPLQSNAGLSLSCGAAEASTGPDNVNFDTTETQCQRHERQQQRLQPTGIGHMSLWHMHQYLRSMSLLQAARREASSRKSAARSAMLTSSASRHPAEKSGS